MAGNMATALEQYDKAESMGRPTPLAVAQHIRLLAQIGRWTDAGKLLSRIPETSRQAMLGPLYPEILFRTNKVDEALRQARTATENDPDNAQNQFWYSQLLFRSAQQAPEEQRKQIIGQAIQAMQRTTELQPEFPEAWFALIGYNMALGNEEAAQKTLRDAQLVLSGDNLPLFLARSYETLANSKEPTSRWFDAETMYRAVYEAAPDDYQRVQQLAAFYMGPVYQRPDRQAKATPLINKLLRAGAEGKLPPGDPNLSWARRMAAKLLALTGDYQNLVKASNLLASNSKDGILPVEDKLALAEILASRPEPLSRFKAIALLEEASTPTQPLSEQAEIVLGELYYATGADWQKYSSKMQSVIGHYPNSVLARDTFVRKLLKRGDQDSLRLATRYIDEIRKLNPNGVATFELTVRLATKLGKQEEVRKLLVSRLPDFSKIKEFPPDQMATLEKFAEMLIELNDLDSAERIYRELVARDPKKVYALAKFLGLHRDAAQCFEELNKVYSTENLPDILNAAVGVARERRDKIGDKFDGQIERWLEAGLRENPDSITLLVVKADVYDLQKKYDEAAAVYRDLLKRNDLVGIRRAVVLNNLAFLLALKGSSAGTDLDAMKLVQEAIQIMGPNSDILDTRAVVFISRDKYKEAINDLNLSVTDGPTASKYFHKAHAHLGANENSAALDAWKKAEELGLSRDSINRMEHDLYEQLKSKIEQLGGKSVTQAEPLRKAG
jgi:tetratricopeptide (TPR) repeat protein